ncbi:MAG: ABC transporter permease [Planctomycetota bacterium]|nr:ABC transporter permease [Planctomycetota bacterium]
MRRTIVTIRAGSGLTALNLAEVWRFRELLGGLAFRDIKLRYRQTALGAAWVILQPLMAAGIFSFVFGSVAKLSSGKLPYFVFSYAGLLGWNAFSSTLTKASSCLVGNANLVSKVYFPRLILPLSIVPSTLIDFAIAMVVMVGMMIWFKVQVTAAIFLLPVWFILIQMMALGAGLYASALMVSYRDVQYILPVAVQMLLYGSPIAYMMNQVPEKLRIFVLLNPLSELMEAFRWSLVGEGAINWVGLSYSIAVSIAAFVIGAMVFKQMERKFADVI